MPLLIDCYNLLHAEKPPALAGLDTAGLCRLLGRSRWAGQRIVVVCDGRPAPLGLVESPTPAVELVYSGPHRSADAVLIELIERDTGPRRLTLASSDRAIQKAARRRRARVLTSEGFLHELATQLRGNPLPPANGLDKPDPGRMPPGEVKAWLKHFGYETDTPPAERAPEASDFEPERDPDVPWPPPDVER